MRTLLLTLLFAGFFSLVASSSHASLGRLVFDTDFADPAMLHVVGDGYFAFATQTAREVRETRELRMVNVQVAFSRNGVDWKLLPDALPAKPKWASRTQNFWAPHAARAGKKFLLYFSAQRDRPNRNEDMCIGVATSDLPEGPYVDIGTPLSCAPGFEDIDPMFFRDPITNQLLLYWGSGFGPIWVRELDKTGTAFAPGSKKTPVLYPDPKSKGYTRLLEGAWVIERAGYYYLFVSGDSCCEPPHYAVLVARAKTPYGPFEYREKDPLPIIEADDDWLAPGHPGFMKDRTGRLWAYFHAIDRRRPRLKHRMPTSAPVRRVLLRSTIVFEDGWPVSRAE